MNRKTLYLVLVAMFASMVVGVGASFLLKPPPRLTQDQKVYMCRAMIEELEVFLDEAEKRLEEEAKRK